MSALSNLKASTAVVAPVVTRDEDEALLANIETVRESMTEEDYATMRNHYSSTYGKETTLDDEAILLIVASSKDDMDPKSWAGLMRDAEVSESNEAMVVSETVSSDILTRAHNLGEKLAKSPTFVPQMSKLMDANELTKRGDAVVFHMLNGMWNDNDWSQVPKPGVKKSDLPDGSNEPYDIWTVKDHAHEGKSIKYSFFNETAKAIPYFQELLTELEDVSDVLKTNPELGNERRLTMRNSWTMPKQKAHKATLSARKSKFIGTIKKACQLKRQIDTVNAYLGKGVKVQLLTEKQPNGPITVLRTTAPIEVSHMANPSICATYTVTTFLKLDPEKALTNSRGEADAMFAALDATLARGTKNKGPATEASKYPPVTDPADFDSCLATLSNYVDEKDNLLALRKWFKEGTPEEREEKVRDFGDAYLPLQQVWQAGIRTVYEELNTRDVQAAERAANMGIKKTGT